jgi:hypothetical protein
MPNKYNWVKEAVMGLAMWVVWMFVLGIVALGLCFMFLKACEKI